MSDQQPSKTPNLDYLFKGDVSVGLEPEIKTWAEAQEYSEHLQQKLSTANAENILLRQKCFADDCDSAVASCNCMAKSPEIQHHKKGCKYRLITERDAANSEAERLKAEAQQVELYKRALRDAVNTSDALAKVVKDLLANSKALAEALDKCFGADNVKIPAIEAHNKLMEQFK